jgi:hypothetical protein
MIYILAIGAGIAGAFGGWIGGILAATAAGIDVSSTAGVNGQLAILAIGPAGAVVGMLAAIALTLVIKDGCRSLRDIWTKTSLVIAMIGILVAGTLGLRASAFNHLGLIATAPAVEFEIRLPATAASALSIAGRSQTQVELHTDQNQALAQIDRNLQNANDGRFILRGHVPLEFRTAKRVVVINLPGQGYRAFRLRLPANPSPSNEFGPWHLPDRIGGEISTVSAVPDDTYAIRYRVL